MTKNAKVALVSLIGTGGLLLGILILRDVWLKNSVTISCDDGTRRRIDTRDFSTQYSAYSLELEASIADKASISTKLSPVQLQELSEATQNGLEFRKFVVAGFNSCAITKVQYAQMGGRFQALDGLAREINEMTRKGTLPPEQEKRLTGLIEEYKELARKLGSG